jgi:hypothetical protein
MHNAPVLSMPKTHLLGTNAVTPWVYVHEAALSTSNDVYQVFDHLPVLVVLETHRTVPFDRHQFVFKPEP